MKRILLILIPLLCIGGRGEAQTVVRVNNLLNAGIHSANGGELFIYHDAAIDTLISRHIAASKNDGGINGYRIQVFRKAGSGAREEADKAMARVINDYPEHKAYQGFVSPNLFYVRMGDFRTKIEASRVLARVRRGFPDSYLVAQKINAPEPVRK